MNNSFIPELEKIKCVVSKDKMISVLAGSKQEPYDLAHISDFNSLIAVSQQLSKPVFALTDEEIESNCRFTGMVMQNIVKIRESFNQCFTELADRILNLTS